MAESGRLKQVDRRRTLTRTALVAILTLVGVGCTITPIEEVQSPTPARSVTTGAEPESLAFNDETEPVSAKIEPAGSSALLEELAAGAWVQITDSARIGVHSAPDTV